MLRFIRLLCQLLLVFVVAKSAYAQTAIPDTQNPKDKLSTPAEALKSIKLPPGFKAQMFAHEPEVIQPVNMTFDSRGRLWISECLTYAESKTNFDLTLKDRIVILEDTDNDGVHDKRTVFWDQGHHLTSALPGFGGVWVLCAPNLLFIPDRNGDDKPDGEPEIILNGFDNNSIRHNIVNGLAWGPDGWLYGRHGITTTSFVGTPDTPASKRIPINCGVWRYHPTKKIFEVVCRGGTNSWGLDWDAHGNAFFINTVIGHFWHSIPGAYFKRMFGEHFNPRLFELIDQHADHYHWDRVENWSDIRNKGVTPTTDKAGGGHAHCGFMIYQGDNWPADYQGKAFTANLHGRRINADRIEAHGNGFVARHEPDFMNVGDLWFRGIELCYGPDGGVFIIDWSDVGECHENDGVHRNSGRIYKITHGEMKKKPTADLSKMSNLELVDFVSSSNEWQFRQARRILQERAALGMKMQDAEEKLNSMFAKVKQSNHKLRSLWMLYAISALDAKKILALLDSEDEQVRSWGVRFLMEDEGISGEALSALEKIAPGEKSALVRLYLASVLQKVPVGSRGNLALALAARSEDKNDHNQPLMLWYGIEPTVSLDPSFGVKLAKASAMGKHRTFVARVLAEEIDTNPKAMNELLLLAGSLDLNMQKEIALGLQDGLRGRRKAKAPEAWNTFATRLASSQDADAVKLGREIAIVFGDGRALGEVMKIAGDSKESAGARVAAISTLVENKAKGIEQILPKLVNDRSVSEAAIRGLASFNLPETPKLIMSQFGRLDPAARKAAIDTLCSRPAYATELLNAVGEGKVPRDAITAYHARQIAAFNDTALNAKLSATWGEVRIPTEKKKEQIAKLRTQLEASNKEKVDLVQGRLLFQKVCANCHGLFGQGGNLGPDLTGSQRSNLEYLLENILEPNATVAADYRMSAVTLKDGRLLTGLVFKRANKAVEVIGPTEKKTVLAEDIDSIKPLNVSPMPENLLETLKPEDIRNLFGYLMSPVQVLLPK